MKVSLLSKLRDAMKRGGFDEYEISKDLVERGSHLPLYLWESITPPASDIWLAAELLTPWIKPSDLFELTEYRADLAWAFFKEEAWPRYRDTIPITEEAAWQHITTLHDFRHQSTDQVKKDILLILGGLVPPSPRGAGRVTCMYPDCNGYACGLVCGITGERRGQESW